MIRTLCIATTLSTALILLRFAFILFTKNNWKNSFKELDIKDVALEWLFSVTTFFCFFSISIFFKNATQLILVLLGVLSGSFFISYGFFIYPFLILIRKKKYSVATQYEDWAKVNLNNSIVIRILKGDITNAYATGVLSASKVILLSEKLMEKLDEKHIKNIILHEYAHLRYNHLLILYFSNVLCCSLSVISASHFYPIFETSSNAGLLVAFHGALFGGLYILIPGLVQRQLEYQADKYAASCVGADSYAETLVALNVVTDGGLEKKSINYPTLSDRINNVSR